VELLTFQWFSAEHRCLQSHLALRLSARDSAGLYRTVTERHLYASVWRMHIHTCQCQLQHSTKINVTIQYLPNYCISQYFTTLKLPLTELLLTISVQYTTNFKTSTGSQSGGISPMQEFQGFRENWSHRQTDSICCNIYLFADLTKAIPITIAGPKYQCCTDAKSAIAH